MNFLIRFHAMLAGSLRLAAGLCLVLHTTLPPYPELPVPVSNNVVAATKQNGDLMILSALGIGAKRRYDAITNSAYMLRPGKQNKWHALPPIPGPGRLAASAVGVRGRFFIFGGYTVAADGKETSLPNVDIFDPASSRWSRGANIPVPVDDSVALLYRDRYVYLISGWSQTDNVRHVQVYDIEKNLWEQATPISGTPVFGHAGGIVGNAIIYLDGAYKNPRRYGPKYIASDECWRGEISSQDFRNIRWTKLPPHPGNARYRIAAGSGDGMIYFAGGTDNPYNYDGIGYDGRPSQPSAAVFAWNEKQQRWSSLPDDEHPSMDHRGLVVAKSQLIIVGGMYSGQQVKSVVKFIPVSNSSRR